MLGDGRFGLGASANWPSKRMRTLRDYSVIDQFDNPFMHDAFLKAGETSVTKGRVCVVSHAGYKLAYTLERSPFALGCRVLRVWSHGYAPLGGCYFAGNEGAPRSSQAFSLLLDEAVRLTDADLILWPYFPTETMEYRAIGQWMGARAGAFSPIVTREHLRAFLDSSDPLGEDGLAGLSLRKKKRKELGRQSRRMADLGKVLLVSTWQGLDQQDALAHFLNVEASGWKATKGTALASDAKLTAMVNEFLPQMLEERLAQIDLMLLDGRCVAGMVSMRAGRGLFTWKIGMDEAFARFSPGVQIMLAVSRMAIADKTIDYVDSLADPDHPMVDHLWAGRRAYAFLFLPLSYRGVWGAQAMNFAMAGKDQARHLARRLLRR